MGENPKVKAMEKRIAELEERLREYEQKGAEKHLREMARRFEKIAEMGDDGIIVFDEQYKIEFANTVASELTEYPKERLMGMDFRHLLTERDHGYLDRMHS
ncbi:MAG: PAS domain-containing protein, partial [Deltaproteobacteria bacterium]|nr:PAS domain-containing protein [Deltaproteobacteria bacterium]